MERALPPPTRAQDIHNFPARGDRCLSQCAQSELESCLSFLFFSRGGVDLGPPLKQFRTYREYIYDTE